MKGAAQPGSTKGAEKGGVVFTSIPEIGFLRLSQVLALIPVGRSTWWAWCATGKAPAPLKLSPKVTVWHCSAVRAFIENLGRSEQKVM